MKTSDQFTDRQIAAAVGAESHRQLITWRQRGHLPNRRKDVFYAMWAFSLRTLADCGINLYAAASAARPLAGLMLRALKDDTPRLVAISPTGTVVPLPVQLDRLPFGGTTLIVFDVNHGAALVRDRLQEFSGELK
jgi:hypothetical protein